MAGEANQTYDYELAYDEVEDGRIFFVLRRPVGSTETWRIVVVEDDPVLAKDLLRDLRSGSRLKELDDGKELRQNVTELPRDR